MAIRHSYAGSSQHFNGAGEQEEGQGFMGQIRGAGEAVQSQAQHVVSDYPISTVLAVFGVGLGVGVVLGSAMFSSSSSCPSSSNWFPSMGSSGSSWFPSMSSNSSSWFPSSSGNNSWFGGNSGSNWSDSMMQSAKNMCGY